MSCPYNTTCFVQKGVQANVLFTESYFDTGNLMKLQLIRNATLLLDYAGRHILIDPFFAPKQSRPSYVGKGENANPMTELPLAPEKILEGVELVMVSHLHSDHFDPVAQQLVPKDWPLLCQPGDEATISGKGFQQVSPITQPIDWQGIHLTRTDGHHGTGEVEGMMGKVSGFVFRAEDEPTIYWAGDTILCDEVRAAIQTYQPDIIITHSCGATWADSQDERSLIVMDDQQTAAVCQIAPESIVIATHMEALDHSTISRVQLRSTAQAAGIDEAHLRIPADGEVMEFSS
jgi:L-ascorbate metabolism protein UlaG (beta-lactamase superfamily)